MAEIGGGARDCPGGRGRKIGMIQRQDVGCLQCHVEVLYFIHQRFIREERQDQLGLRELTGGSLEGGLEWGKARWPGRRFLQWAR